MTNHKRAIILAILAQLKERDGGTIREELLHSLIYREVSPPATLSDFEESLRFCEGKRWVVGVTGPLGDRAWGITPDGEAFHRSQG